MDEILKFQVGKKKSQKRTHIQKNLGSFTWSFLALTYWFHFTLISIFKKLTLFPTTPDFCFYIGNKWGNECYTRLKLYIGRTILQTMNMIVENNGHKG